MKEAKARRMKTKVSCCGTEGNKRRGKEGEREGKGSSFEFGVAGGLGSKAVPGCVRRVSRRWRQLHTDWSLTALRCAAGCVRCTSTNGAAVAAGVP